MSQENVEVVRGLYDAWNRRDYAVLAAASDPEVEAEVRVGGDFDETYRGLAGVWTFVQYFWDNFDEGRTEIEECVPAGDEVVVGVHLLGRGKVSGANVDMRMWHVWTLRDEKVVGWRLLRTRAEALEAVGLSE